MNNMSKLDNLKKAKQIIQNITRGQHPYTGEAIKSNEVCADERVIQWFNFIEEQLGVMIERSELSREKYMERTLYVDFSITREQLNNFVYSEKPITITEVAHRLNEISKNESINELQPVNLNAWLIADGLLIEEDTQYGKMKVPTEMGKQLGIYSQERSFDSKSYISVTYSIDAQRYIVNHILDYLSKYKRKHSNKALPIAS